jgi:hypothetical protein
MQLGRQRKVYFNYSHGAAGLICVKRTMLDFTVYQCVLLSYFEGCSAIFGALCQLLNFIIKLFAYVVFYTQSWKQCFTVPLVWCIVVALKCIT